MSKCVIWTLLLYWSLINKVPVLCQVHSHPLSSSYPHVSVSPLPLLCCFKVQPAPMSSSKTQTQVHILHPPSPCAGPSLASLAELKRKVGTTRAGYHFHLLTLWWWIHVNQRRGIGLAVWDQEAPVSSSGARPWARASDNIPLTSTGDHRRVLAWIQPKEANTGLCLVWVDVLSSLRFTFSTALLLILSWTLFFFLSFTSETGVWLLNNCLG